MFPRRWLLLLLSFVNLALLVFPSCPLAHGVRGHLYQGKALGVEISYSDGTPMSYARVKVYFDREKIPFQTGVTDRNGRFLFAPDRPGVYRVIVEDGEGHRLEMELKTGEGNLPQAREPKSFQVWTKALLGLFLIFLLFGLLKAAFNRKRRLFP